jgi:hypothetical protein
VGQEKKKGFVLYYDYRQHLALLTDEERGQLLTALLDYGEHGKEPKLDGAAQMAFSFIRAQMDRDEAKYIETCRKRSEAGRQGGRPKAKESDEKQTEAKKANAFSEKQNKAKKADTETDTETDTDTDTDTDIKIPPSPPRGTAAQDRRFAEFWQLYPKKVGKASCLKAWQKLKPDAELFEHIMNALSRQKASEQWQREGGRFIPNPLTWLNQGRWDDEPIEAPRLSTAPTGKSGILNKLREMYEAEGGEAV